MRRAGTVAAALMTVGWFVAGCDSHAPVGGVSAAPTYSTALRPITECGPEVRAPAARSAVTPAVSGSPTAVLRAGDAVTVAARAGGTIGFAGLASNGERSVLCRLPNAGTGQLVLVARAPGYVRVAVVASGAGTPAVAFIKVTS